MMQPRSTRPCSVEENGFALIPTPWGARHPGPPGRSPAKKQVANLPQDVELGMCWSGFCFFIAAVWPAQIVKQTHVFDFLWDGCDLKHESQEQRLLFKAGVVSVNPFNNSQNFRRFAVSQLCQHCLAIPLFQ